jgi:hypothetical protein
MLRRAGITQLPGIIPSPDQYGELIPEINRMMAGFSLDGHKIFTTSIDRYTLTANQQTYLIGPDASADGAALNPVIPGFDAARPIFIYRANIVIVGSSPELHLPLGILTDGEWAAKTIPALQASWSWQLYNDGAVPNSKLFLYGIPGEANDLELFTWQSLQHEFTSEDNAVILPQGYEDLIVTQGALRVRALYPYDSKLSGAQLQELRTDATRALQTVKIMNTESTPFYNEAALLNGTGSGSLRAAFERWGANL